MRCRLCAFLLLTLFLFPGFSLANRSLTGYEFFTGIGRLKRDSKPLIILRRFSADTLLSYLTVDPGSLSTAIHSKDELTVRGESWEALRKTYSTSRYFRTLAEAEANARTLQDAGITRLTGDLPGIVLTVDLCPSRNPMDRVLFTELLAAFGTLQKPVPVSVSITGLWMKKHREDFEWLVQLSRTKEISITWINHTYHHRSGKELPMNENFLLEKGTNLPEEILETEKLLVEKGITPSVFFRFPGLVSDEKTFLAVTAYGLVPVGSDAWLGKNQYPKEGSIVLLHANGNETIGIKRFLKMIREGKNVAGKNWVLLDLREGLADEKE